MRDGVVLRADVLRPEAPGRFPALLVRTPYGKKRRVERGRLRDARGARGLRGRGPGRARPLRLRGRLRSLPPGRARRVRHDRLGRRAAVLRRPGGPHGPLVPGGGAVARRGRGAAPAQGDGAGDDVLERPQLLLLRRSARSLVAGVVLRGDRTRRAPAARPPGPEDRRRGGPRLGGERRRPGCATSRCARIRRSRASRLPSSSGSTTPTTARSGTSCASSPATTRFGSRC